MKERGLYFEWGKSNLLCNESDILFYDEEFYALVLNNIRVDGRYVPFGNVSADHFWGSVPNFEEKPHFDEKNR